MSISTWSWLFPVTFNSAQLDPFDESLPVVSLNGDVRQSFFDLLLDKCALDLFVELAFSLLNSAPKSMCAQGFSFLREFVLDWVEVSLDGSDFWEVH